MSYQAEWLQEGKVIILRIGVHFAAEEIPPLSNDIIALLEKGTPPVHLVIDASQVKTFPTNIAQARRDATYLNHPSLGWSTYFGMSPVISSILKVFNTMTQANLASLRTLDQALAFLHSKDSAVKLDVP